MLVHLNSEPSFFSPRKIRTDFIYLTSVYLALIVNNENSEGIVDVIKRIRNILTDQYVHPVNKNEEF